MKKFAYLFLVGCIGIAGYLVYDTYRIATSDQAGDADNAEEVQIDPGEIAINFNDYEIEKKTTVSLLEEVEGEKVLYLYENEQSCEEGALDYSNVNLLAVVKFSGDSGDYKIESVSVFKRTIEGNTTEISSIPTTSFELNTEGTDNGLKGDLKFVWGDEERVIEGEFDAGVCELAE